MSKINTLGRGPCVLFAAALVCSPACEKSDDKCGAVIEATRELLAAAKQDGETTDATMRRMLTTVAAAPIEDVTDWRTEIGRVMPADNVRKLNRAIQEAGGTEAAEDCVKPRFVDPLKVSSK